MLVASIPVLLLWRVRVGRRQKFGLGVVLCLSLVMAVFRATGAAGVRRPRGDVDIVWLDFWAQQECSVAVLMVSMIAFRSFFVGGPGRRRGRGIRGPRYTSSY